MNKTLTNLKGDKFKVISEFRKLIKGRSQIFNVIRFEATGYEQTVLKSQVTKLKVTDKLKKDPYGFSTGDYKKDTAVDKHLKKVWQNIRQKCSNENEERRFTAKESWKCFASFYEEIQKVENYDKWLLGVLDGEEKYVFTFKEGLRSVRHFDDDNCYFEKAEKVLVGGEKSRKTFFRKSYRTQNGTQKAALKASDIVKLDYDLDFGFAYAFNSQDKVIFQVCLEQETKDHEPTDLVIRKADCGYDWGLCGELNREEFDGSLKRSLEVFLAVASVNGFTII